MSFCANLGIFLVVFLVLLQQVLINYESPLLSDAMMDYSDRVVIITGANSGLGAGALTNILSASPSSRLPSEIIIGCRTITKCADALAIARAATNNKETKVTSLQLDLTATSSIDDFATNVAATASKVDVLLNNAGIMGTPLIPRNPETNAEQQMHVNHLGHFYLVHKLMPLLKKGNADPYSLSTDGSAGKARVVSHSSLSHLLAWTWDNDNFDLHKETDAATFTAPNAYAVSKKANLLFTHSLNAKYGKDIAATSAHPGNSFSLYLFSNCIIFLTFFFPSSSLLLPFVFPSSSLPLLSYQASLVPTYLADGTTLPIG
jgi:NAD(P)-dependent dehydrogenase (short-subunit alcohol dehydrogenase family)